MAPSVLHGAASATAPSLPRLAVVPGHDRPLTGRTAPLDLSHPLTTAKILGEIERLMSDACEVLTEATKNTDLDQNSIDAAFLVSGEDLFRRLKIIEMQIETLRSGVAIDSIRSVSRKNASYKIRTPDILRLSSRETEVGRLISGGFTNQQIARRLRISHKTVETYIARIFKKLDVLSRAEIARIFGFHKLV